MRAFLLLLLLTLSPPAFAEDRFSPDNPTFAQFEKTCRQGPSGIVAECKGGVLGAAMENGFSTCDFAAFWREADKLTSKFIDVLPWQSVVEQMVAKPGVCQKDIGL